MAQMGEPVRDIPLETQFLLLESKDGSLLEPNGDDKIIYTVFLPLIECQFCCSIQGNSRHELELELELCLEGGDADTKSNSFSHPLFVGAANSTPFAAISGTVQAVKAHLKTFCQLPEKKLPGIVDYFGWCTWDAFYQEVTQEGIEAGLLSLNNGRSPLKFLIIYDGWQSVATDENPGTIRSKDSPALKGTASFQSKDDPASGITSIVMTAKENYGLKYVYVWHVITGSRMQYAKILPGVVENVPELKTNVLTVQGLRLVKPKSVYKFYSELHG